MHKHDDHEKRWRSMRLPVLVLPIVLASAAACSSTTRRVEVVPGGSASATTATTTSDAATTVPDTQDAFVAPTGAFTIKALPSGYVPRGSYQQTDGPAPGAHIEYQVFVNLAAREQIAVTVQTGDVSRSVVLNPSGQEYPYTRSTRQVASYDTYVSQPDMTGQRVLAWIIGPNELATASVPGEMSDNALFALADGIEVTK
jgi:hypothetical protein